MRNLTIQLDEELIHAAKALAASKGMSLSALVAQDLREKIAAQGRYQRAMTAALESMAEAAGSNRVAPVWTRDERYDRGKPLTEYVFVDTDVLVYAHGVSDADPRASKARAVLGDLWRTDTGVLSTQVLQEFHSVATRKLGLEPKHARGIVASYAEWCTVNTDVGLIVSGSKLTEEHSISFWDALIIEAALRANASRLLSEDLQHGRKFGDLIVENPFRGRGADEQRR